MHELLADFQCTNLIAKRSAIEVVDRAMNAVGGSSYMNRARWRDVGAGSLMKPFTPVEAYRYVASITLGAQPDFD